MNPTNKRSPRFATAALAMSIALFSVALPSASKATCINLIEPSKPFAGWSFQEEGFYSFEEPNAEWPDLYTYNVTFPHDVSLNPYKEDPLKWFSLHPDSSPAKKGQMLNFGLPETPYQPGIPFELDKTGT